MKKNIRSCVVGGAGFIGSHLADRLIELGHDVIVIDNLVSGKIENVNEKATFVKADICDFDTISPWFEDIDYVFHLAAVPRVQESIEHPLISHDSNVTGTLNVLWASHLARVKRVIFSSSSSVYGDQDVLPMVETMMPNPMSPYAAHKLIGEEYCTLFSKIYDLSTICLRYMNVFGKRQDPGGEYANLIPKFIQKMSQGEIPTIFGDGEQTRDFVAVNDVVNANILAMKSRRVGIINIGSGKEMSVNQIAKILQEKLNVNIPPIHGPAVIEPRRVVADITMAKNILGWEPNISFDEGIERMIKQ